MPTPSPEETLARLDAAAARLLTPVGAGTMVWRVWGEGPPVVLLHGATGSWRHWVRNIPALARRFRLLVPDMPGFGHSDPPPPPGTVHELAQAIAAGLDAVAPGPAPLDVAGFSFGGIVGGLVAARPDARIRRLVLIGTGGMALPQEPTRPLRRLAPGMTPREVEAVHRENLAILMLAAPEAADDLAVRVQMENAARARFKSGDVPTSRVLLDALPSIRARLAGIWGERDAFAAPHVDARRRTLQAVQPDADFHVVPGAGHWAIYEAADEVNALLIELLGGDGGAPGGPLRAGR